MKNLKKDGYWFPHYSNTKNEPLIARMRMILGAEAYGIYIMILELMRDEEEYKLNSSYEVIAYNLNLQNHDIVKKVIEDFGLFEFENDSLIVSKRLNKLMSGYDKTIIDSQINGYKSALIKHRDYTKVDLKSLPNKEIQRIYQKEFLDIPPKMLDVVKTSGKVFKSSFNKESIGDESIADEKKINSNKIEDDVDFQILLKSYFNKLASDQSKIYEFVYDMRNNLTSENFPKRLEGFVQTLKENEVDLDTYDHFIELFIDHQNRNYGT
ncbi:protein of unknown function [Nonlabens sp. Hel1_33_55]|uniref:Lin1244/Lin1753 domain-containing protein n=1 Tax=Nonlabens sp. Hel1_33_55 TaxID=1336802 RepID=UPI000875CCC8|nr:Lin1244/Lin1753 domain-containing protein [Nonlabens sp. Hel1_33_55]SCY19077.1 protein of unknown function [Nonlabens sp. Hel1_33_55]